MLGPQRTVLDLNLNFVQARAGEAGGIVSFVEISGVTVVGYITEDIANAQPLGIQLNAVENMDLSRHYHPALDRRMRRVDRPGSMVGLARKGTYDTNFVHPNCQAFCGQGAYLGVSGLLTHENIGPRVGTFMSNINDALPGMPQNGPSIITIFGGGYTREDVFIKTYEGWERTTQGEERQTVNSPGYVRIQVSV